MNMKNTYKTYQECKLANPDCTVITCFTNSEGLKNKVVEFEALTRDHFSREVADWVVCNHTDYLPSAEWFFSEGYKLVEGDAIVDLMGKVLFVGGGSHADFCNYKTGDENEFFILRAKALQDETKDFNSVEDSIKETVSEQFAELVNKAPIFTPYYRSSSVDLNQEKPRSKVEYEKANFEPEEIWKAFKEHQEVGFLYVKASDEYECLLDGVFNLAMAISQGDQLYRKVERPVEWWEDAVEYIRSLNGEANAIDFTDSESEGKQIAINVSVVLDERQAKDLARILLEQESE